MRSVHDHLKLAVINSHGTTDMSIEMSSNSVFKLLRAAVGPCMYLTIRRDVCHPASDGTRV